MSAAVKPSVSRFILKTNTDQTRLYIVSSDAVLWRKVLSFFFWIIICLYPLFTEIITYMTLSCYKFVIYHALSSDPWLNIKARNSLVHIHLASK